MDFRFSFKNWLLSEATVAQYFKGTKEFPAEVVNNYRKMVSTLFPGIALNTATLSPNIDKAIRLNIGRIMSRLAK